jgi:tRNA dimethylallyltransferase
MKGIGYKELLDHFAGLYPMEEAVRLIKRNTRHYAKRQLTWFRRYEEMAWFNGSNYPDRESWLEDMYEWADRKS